MTLSRNGQTHTIRKFNMKPNSLLRLYLLMLICFVAINNGAQESAGGTTWRPDIFTINETNIVWGVETNHVKAGLAFQYATGPSNRTLVGFFFALYNNSDTNGNISPNTLKLWLPPLNSRYNMTLFDSRNNVIAKTEFGKSLDQPFDATPNLDNIDIYHGYVGLGLIPFNMDLKGLDPIVLENCFTITNAGKYHLKFVLNTLRGDDQGIQPLYLPVDANIEIKKP
jgi:hypothetical protein